MHPPVPQGHGTSMSRPSSPPAVTRGGADELPAYISNGLVGLRVLDVPLLPGVVNVSGFAGLHPEMEVEAGAEAPYPIAGDLVLNGVRLSSQPQLADFIDQSYDFSNGELTTRFRFAAGEATATVEILTFCSRQRPTMILQEVAVEVDRAADLEIRALVDTTKIHGRMISRHTRTPGKDPDVVDGSLEWEALGGRSSLGVAYVTELLGEPEAERKIASWGIESDLATDYVFRARTGRRYRLRQIAAIVPSVVHHDPDHQALRLLGRASEDGWDRLRAENRSRWDELWRGRVLIDADDDRWQQLADAAFFYLNTSAHPSSPSSISMYGLATWNNYHYYYGHVMWDIDFFGVPPLLLTQPDAARALLEFRSNTIRAARQNAKMHGRKGLQFPWESGSVDGEEVAPGVGRASWHEDHVSLDVAWAFAQYVHATGDGRFLAEDASRILYGVADWAASRVTKARNGYDWLETMGIAERKTPSDNEAFTLMLAKVVLDEAIACATRLSHTVAEEWVDVARGISPRVSQHTGGVMSHDGFHPGEEKGATPGPLAGIFPVWANLDPAVEAATLRYYLDLAPDYIGSPMLSPLYGVWAAWAGDRRLAARLYEQGYASMIGPRFMQTLEMTPSKEPDKPPSGPFFANIGGFLMGLMYGLPGLRLSSEDPSMWPSRPVVLPAGWRSIEIERAWAHGKPVRIVAPHGADRAEIINGRSSRRAPKAA